MINRNPGRSDELSVGLAIGSRFSLDTAAIRRDIVRRPDAAEILSLSERLAPHLNALPIIPTGAKPLQLMDATQDDEVGPSDWIVTYSLLGEVARIGLSVKQGTDVSRNPTGRLFLSSEQIDALGHTLRTNTIPEFRSDMEQRFGQRNPERSGHDNWYRKRSQVTTIFLDQVGSLVADAWNNTMSPEQRRQIAASLSHSGSLIPYVVIKLSRNPPKADVVSEDESKLLFLDTERVACVSLPLSQYVQFFHETHESAPIARMQVKFNDGILRHIEGREIVGDAFQSWNFQFMRLL